VQWLAASSEPLTNFRVGIGGMDMVASRGRQRTLCTCGRRIRHTRTAVGHWWAKL